jgi:deazaflavin-dependent oxidoreductase (nitroreductase family)
MRQDEPVTVKDLAFRCLNFVHRGVIRLSGGRIGANAWGMPVVELTTTGRVSGQPRETLLTSPLVDGDTVMLVASFGGDDREPAWCRNIRANADIKLTMDGTTRKMHARVADPAERAELWPRIISAHPNYASYQRKTDREIPVVIATPVG